MYEMYNINKLIKSKHNELIESGSVRFYENEGFDLADLMERFEIMFDEKEYSMGIIDNGNGSFLELVKYN